MTELFIDRQPVVLPKDFSLDVIAENPFFTKNGTSTLELTLSLSNPENAKIYRHCNRINSRQEIASGRTALLVADNNVLLNGTEIILEITDKEVKIQLLSGESELNYLIGGDKKLNSLDLGSFNYSSTEEAAGVFIPVFSSNEEMVYNEPLITDYSDIITASGCRCPLIQPKLSFLVKKIINAQGYSIQNSVFEAGFLQYIRILNGRKTVKYSEMLPDWTVSEFFTELENLFNIAFLVDQQNKTVSVLFKNDFYKSTSKIFIDEVMDEFAGTVDRENKCSYSQSNIGYDLTGDIYFKYQKPDKTIVDRAETVTFPPYEDISHCLIDSMDTLCYSPASGTQYIFKNSYITGTDSVLYHETAPLPVTETEEGDGSNYMLPDFTGEPVNIQEIPTGYEEDGEESQSSAGSPNEPFIFFYTGLHDIYPARTDSSSTNSYHTGYDRDAAAMKKVQYPVGFVDFLCEDGRFGERPIDGSKLSPRPDSDHGLKPLYDSLPVDTVREYAFKFVCRKNLDAKAIFVFNSKNFVCKQLKYTVRPEGTDPLVEGVFYPVD